MNSMLLEAAGRDSTVKAKHLRNQGKIPANYYGKGQKNMQVALDLRSFAKMFQTAGENTIIELKVDGKTYPVLVHDVQYDPLLDTISHVDFIHVDMNKEVTTSVKVTFVGTSPAVKTLGGILDIQKHELKIKCLPKDLIHSVEVDVSVIADFTTTIHVKDVKVPSTIKLMDKPEEPVVTAVRPRAEEEATPAATATAEGAAPAEGAAAGAATPAAAEGAAAPAKDAKK